MIEQNQFQQGEKKKEKIKRLSLTPIKNMEGLFVGTKKDGKSYTVRKDRHRTFFPDEWLNFIASLKPDKVFIFETLLMTGARIEECLNIRVKDFFWDRNYIRLYVTKSKATKGESKEIGGRARSFAVSSQYIKKAKAYIKERNINNEDKLFKYSKQGVYQLFRRKLQEIGIKDWYNFSLHNIRKTNGMWLKTLIPYSREITEGEICNRLGHDFNTYLKHYASPSIFNEKDKNMMMKILGDIYGLVR
jgi:integrase